ncbi:unnamed protein product [Mytilus coruscus]|uniref:receptor protein-tyrosine kinase n=1 Tax=Mytilus coruscus TaxID=42192 RepID=A0A6J8BL48_MYTCO|nr:unnamed protein product [Mytilus coruscus]
MFAISAHGQGAMQANNVQVPPAPQEVVVSRSSWKTIRITWNEPKVPVSGYRIFYSLFDVENLDSWQSIDIGPYRVAEITGLAKMSYAIRVAAKSLDGRFGNVSAAVLANVPTYSSLSWKPRSRPALRDSIVTKNEGDDVKLTCGVKGNPKPRILWFRNGRMFDDGMRSKTTLHRYSLIMRDVQVDDKGDYQCIVTNVHGSLNFTFYVTIIKLTWPLQVEVPQNQTVNEGDDAIFTCRPLNDHEATIKWVKRNQTGLHTSIGKTSDILENKETLVLRSVNMRDAGHYVCFVGNYFGLKKMDVWLTVIPSTTTTTTTTTKEEDLYPISWISEQELTWPLEVEEPQNQTVNEGDDAIFTCRPLNDPEATIKWVKRIQTGLQTSIGKTSDILKNKEMLVLRSVTMKDAGHYVCFVGNYFGLKQVDVWLKVMPTPTPTTTTTTPRKEEDNDIKCSATCCLVQQKDLKDTDTNIVKQLLATFEKKLSEKVEAKVRETTGKLKDQMDSLMIDNENLRERMKAKDKTIERLEEKVSDTHNRAIEAIKLGNYNEQYRRTRNIRMLNYPESPNEVLRDEFVNMVKKDLKIYIQSDDVQEIQRIPGKEGHTNPVIVKVRNTDLKIKIMRQRGQLKNDIRFHDDITQRNLGLMARLKNCEKFENVWFFHCNVYAKQQNGSTIIFDLFDDIEQKLKNNNKRGH